MEYLYEFKSSLSTIFPPTLWDIIDIIVLSYLIYKLISFVKDMRAGGLIKGIVLLFAVYLVANIVQMKTLKYILEQTFDVGILAIIILFQPELRRTLEKVGHSRIYNLSVFSPFSVNADPGELSSRWSYAIDAICEACEDLSYTTTGALIVIERETKLGEQINTGTMLNATPSKEVFGNIFYPKAPLHDGAVVMRDGIILAAGCFLPKPEREELINKELGSRHRAAIGMSENSDALIVVVSEETGTISVAENGQLERGFSKDSLKKYLRGKILPEKAQSRTFKSGDSKQSRKKSKEAKPFKGFSKNKQNKDN